MGYNVLYHRLAARELNEAVAWYFERTPRAADAFLSLLQSAIDEIRMHPYGWPIHEGGVRRMPLSGFPYAIIYAVTDDGILILAIAHGRRKPGYWIERGGN